MLDMFLSDTDIKHAIKSGDLVIEPYDEAKVQPASYDLTLDHLFASLCVDEKPQDIKEPVVMSMMGIDENGSGFVVPSLGFVLASTRERVEIPVNMIGRLEGKSSLGRLGLMAHVTAGFFDPGFKGYPTLELFNAGPRALTIYPGMPICQMSFALLGGHVEHPYGAKELGSKYQGQRRGPRPSEYHRNFDT